MFSKNKISVPSEADIKETIEAADAVTAMLSDPLESQVLAAIVGFSYDMMHSEPDTYAGKTVVAVREIIELVRSHDEARKESQEKLDDGETN